ncbi:unnamed protein product, partial [Allacma fusca]
AEIKLGIRRCQKPSGARRYPTLVQRKPIARPLDFQGVIQSERYGAGSKEEKDEPSDDEPDFEEYITFINFKHSRPAESSRANSEPSNNNSQASEENSDIRDASLDNRDDDPTL